MRGELEFGIVSRLGMVSFFGIVSRRGVIGIIGIVDIVSRFAVVSSGGLTGMVALDVSTGVVVVSCFGTAMGLVTACDGVIGVALFRSTLPPVVSVVVLDPLIPPALMLPPPAPERAILRVGSGIP